MIKRILAAVAVPALAASAMLGTASAASANTGHTVSSTDHFHGVQPFDQVNPCTGDEITGSETSNLVMHVTYFPASDESWSTFTEEDNFSALDASTGVAYSGHDTVWGNANVNQQNANETFTFSVRATGSDGSVITSHEAAHLTQLPDGNISVSFDKLSLTCG
jgi:hypothetical protein